MRFVSGVSNGQSRDLATRLGRTGRWAARLLALTLLVQAGSPAFVSACERSAGGDEHGCPACRSDAATPTAAPVPACHAAAPATSAAGNAPAPKPCCFLEAGPASGHAALPEVTLTPRDGQPLPLELAGDPDGATAGRAAVPDRIVFPPGTGRATSGGPPDALRSTILRL